MPIISGWYDEAKTIYIHRAEGVWTWDQFIQNIAEVYEQLKAWEIRRADFILDFSSTSHVPPNYLSAFNRIVKYWHPNIGLSVWVVGRLMRTLGGVFTRVYTAGKWQYDFADNAGNAAEKIRQWRAERSGAVGST